MKGAFPEVEGIGQDVGFAGEGELLVFVALAGKLESKSQATFDAPARIVFQAWTTPALFTKWWVPKSMPLYPSQSPLAM